ncbi:glycosyltransferase family 9 protein [Actinoalloteichus spitiensis]|uniref:glycosyltransferase family 9 protein n=1 Tax=Actinoalloteichus spitiensis TaxID=252394 RepID=UPI00035C8A5E|nr:glycosyltransferase family 9 protein [Actinoalloteichus spitiensis]
MSPAYRRILVVDLLGGFGDLLMLLPSVHALARNHPRAEVHLLTHPPGDSLLAADESVMAVLVPERRGGGAERAAVQRALARVAPDLVVSSTRYDGIPEVIERSGARAVTDLWRHPPADERVSDRYLRILHGEGLIGAVDLRCPGRVRLTPTELHLGAELVGRVVPPRTSRPPVVLVTGAGMAVKRWPGRRWDALTAALLAAGTPVLAVADGGPVPRGASPLPRGDLRTLAATYAEIGSRGGVVVGGDTGPTRLAASLGVRVVGLFGPTSTLRYGFGRAPGPVPGRDGRQVVGPAGTGGADTSGGGTTSPPRWDDPGERVLASPSGSDLQGLPGCGHRRPTAITEQSCWWSASCPLSPHGPACMAALDVGDVLGAVEHAVRAR